MLLVLSLASYSSPPRRFATSPCTRPFACRTTQRETKKRGRASGTTHHGRDMAALNGPADLTRSCFPARRRTRTISCLHTISSAATSTRLCRTASLRAAHLRQLVAASCIASAHSLHQAGLHHPELLAQRTGRGDSHQGRFGGNGVDYGLSSYYRRFAKRMRCLNHSIQCTHEPSNTSNANTKH